MLLNSDKLLNFAVLPLSFPEKWINLQELILPPDIQDQFSGVNLPNPTNIEGVFEGSGYSDVFESITGYSLESPYINHEEIKEIHRSLLEEINSVGKPFYPDDFKLQQLERFFRVCVQYELALVGYQQE